MKKKVALAATILAFVWMLLPAIDQSVTEIGFRPGDPDPNLYRTTFAIGAPLPWIIAESDHQESEGRNEFQIQMEDTIYTEFR